MPQTRIFLSHSTQDNEWCRPLVATLKANGFDVWYDEQGLTGGSAWVETLQGEVQARDVFIVILSPEAWSSPWVQEEVQLAIATRRMILPVLHKPTQVGGFLMTRQWIDATSLDPQTTAQRIVGALSVGAVFPQPAPPKQVTLAPQILPWPLPQLGFVGRIIDGVEVITPPLCDVPAGPFLAGADRRRDPEASDSDPEPHVVDVPAFRIARYPVTVAEYACAVRVGAMRAPRDWDRQSQRPHHPVVRMSWKNAIDYAAWLAQTTGEPWRPPTEDEWEKAARGTDGRAFPWGDRWEPRLANTSEGGPGDTTPIGLYPDGLSPYGVLDMAGNVNEWCGIPPQSTLYRPGPWGGQPPSTTGYLSGGSWNDSPALARVAHRSQLFIGERTDDTGMRLAFGG